MRLICERKVTNSSVCKSRNVPAEKVLRLQLNLFRSVDLAEI